MTLYATLPTWHLPVKHGEGHTVQTTSVGNLTQSDPGIHYLITLLWRSLTESIVISSSYTVNLPVGKLLHLMLLESPASKPCRPARPSLRTFTVVLTVPRVSAAPNAVCEETTGELFRVPGKWHRNPRCACQILFILAARGCCPAL